MSALDSENVQDEDVDDVNPITRPGSKRARSETSPSSVHLPAGVNAEIKAEVAAIKDTEWAIMSNQQHRMNSYGIRLIDGNTPGGFRNPKEGLTWVEKSATLGFAKAKRNLAVYLSEGIVCEKNGEEALRWAYEAMNQGCADAYYTLGLMYLNGDVVPRDYFKAADFLQQGVDLGNIDCISSLGRQYLKGRGVTKNAPRALELFEKAIGLGHSKAEFYLGCVYAKGYDGVPKDYSKAIEYYERAAKAGVPGAIRNLGHCYEHGNGVPQNYEISLQHLTRAANSGDACALFYIGRKYQHGEGVPQDYIKAHEFFVRLNKKTRGQYATLDIY
ncbi:hypothetical protein HDU78_009347 [Chytriomyces hyalinus]|nr:hypothetical protein HDU78_009347 [Chytriomyces hyalinus]